MAFVADELGVEVVDVKHLHREISPVFDPLSVQAIVKLIKQVRPHILHTHTAKAGAVGRTAALLAGDARPPDRRPHVPRARAARLLRPGAHGGVPHGRAEPGPKATTRLVAVSPEVRDDLVELGVAPAGQVLGHPARDRPRRPDHQRRERRQRSSAACSAFPTAPSSSGGSAG